MIFAFQTGMITLSGQCIHSDSDMTLTEVLTIKIIFVIQIF